MNAATLEEMRRLAGAPLAESDDIASKAAKTQSEFVRIFDKLKSKQSIFVSMKSVMGMGSADTGTFTEFKVGRKSKSKKPRWWSEAVFLMPADGSKPHKFARYKLWKSKKGDRISASHGDMAVELKGLYVP